MIGARTWERSCQSSGKERLAGKLKDCRPSSSSGFCHGQLSLGLSLRPGKERYRNAGRDETRETNGVLADCGTGELRRFLPAIPGSCGLVMRMRMCVCVCVSGLVLAGITHERQALDFGQCRTQQCSAVQCSAATPGPTNAGRAASKVDKIRLGLTPFPICHFPALRDQYQCISGLNFRQSQSRREEARQRPVPFLPLPPPLSYSPLPPSLCSFPLSTPSLSVLLDPTCQEKYPVPSVPATHRTPFVPCLPRHRQTGSGRGLKMQQLPAYPKYLKEREREEET